MPNSAPAAIIAVLGRYGADAEMPFVPKVETRGLDVSPADVAAMSEWLTACWEDTLPWSPTEELISKAETALAKYAASRRWGIVAIEVSVIEGLVKTRYEE